MNRDRLHFWIVPLLLLLLGIAGGLEQSDNDRRATSEAERAANLQRIADTAVLKARMESE